MNLLLCISVQVLGAQNSETLIGMTSSSWPCARGCSPGCNSSKCQADLKSEEEKMVVWSWLNQPVFVIKLLWGDAVKVEGSKKAQDTSKVRGFIWILKLSHWSDFNFCNLWSWLIWQANVISFLFRWHFFDYWWG